jgi:hypothetical protein
MHQESKILFYKLFLCSGEGRALLVKKKSKEQREHCVNHYKQEKRLIKQKYLQRSKGKLSAMMMNTQPSCCLASEPNIL